MGKYLGVFVCIWLLASCSVQKRKYREGFYISWLHAAKAMKADAAKPERVNERRNKAESANNRYDMPGTMSELVSASSEATRPLPRKSPTFMFRRVASDSCDLIIFRDGTEALAKVTEITPTEVKYKRCDFLSGPSYTMPRAKIFMIKFSNGTRHVFESEVPPVRVSEKSKEQDYRGPKQTNTKAVLAIVTGIIGLLLFTGIAAIIFGNQALREMEEQPGRYKGKTMAEIGRSLGYIKLSILVFFIVLIILTALL